MPSNYFDSGDPNYVPFVVVMSSGAWAGSAAETYLGGMDGTVVTPFTYVIVNRGGGVYRIADKFHRQSAYNGEAAHAPKTDLIKLDWAKPINMATLGAYILRRLNDHAAAPTLTVYPDTICTSGPGGVARVKPGSRLRFAFSQKSVGAGTAGNYRFLAGVTPYSPLGAVAGSIPDTNAADGLKATEYLTAGTQETWVGTFDTPITSGLNNANIDFDPGLLLDGAGNPFTLTPANSSPLRFLVDTNAATDQSVTAEVLLTDDPGGASERILRLVPDPGGGASNVVFVLEPARSLAVQIRTLYPGEVPPSATLYKPGGAAVALSFTGLAASLLTQTTLDAAGQYRLHIEAYANGAGGSAGPADYYFAVVVPADYDAGARAGALEGWGYFPREEGLPAACPENGADPDGDGLSVPTWTAQGTGSPSAGNGSPLVFSSVLSYARTYNAMYKNTAGGDPWGASAYVNAMVWAAGTPGASANYFDADNPATALGLTGVGLRLRNGPYLCEICLLTVVSTGQKRVGIRVFHADPEVRAFKLAAGVVDWGSPASPRTFLLKKAGSTYTVSVDGGAAILTVGEKSLPRIHYEELSSTEFGFGVLEDCGQTAMTATFDFVRYAVYDDAYEIDPAHAPNALSVGFPELYRSAADQAVPCFRSPNIHLDGLAGTDPAFASDTPAVAVSAQLTKTAAGALVGKPVPVKLRFCVADFDDSGPLGNRSVLGFTDPSTFPAYGGPEIKPVAGAAVSTRILSAAAGASVTPPPPAALTCSLAVDRSRLRRRLFVLVYADAPLLASPGLAAGKGAGSYFDRTAAAGVRSDSRGVVRQFLPDFYVRDFAGDDGTSNAGGWLSPDIALAIFAGDAAHTLPDPQGTAESHYPKGFALGQPDPFDYTPSGYIPIDSTNPDPTKKIKLTDSGWSDHPSQCYYNRSWVRLSNRGIVPGPANVQLYFLGSVLRAQFAPADPSARNDAYEKLFAQLPTTLQNFVQTRFQRYDAAGNLTGLVEAVPALSGFSDPAATKNYVIAEFVWHVGAAEVPPDPSDNHGCRAACVNLCEQPAWTSGVDSAPVVNTSASIWAANQATNNIAVRNSNIVQGEAPGSADPPVTPKILIQDDSPVTHKKLPNDFKPGFSKKQALWGIKLETADFPGTLVLRVASAVSSGARPLGLTELQPPLPERPLQPRYRFFQLDKGAGGLEGIHPAKGRQMVREQRGKPTPDVSLFFQPRPEARPGLYAVTLIQTADGKPVGGYRSVIAVLKRGEARFVADERTRVLYDLKSSPAAAGAIPYEQRAAFRVPGLAVQQGFRFGPVRAVEFIIGRIPNEMANFPAKFTYPPPPRELPAFPEGVRGAVVGRVVDGKGAGVCGLQVVLREKEELGQGTTDANGRYLIRVRTDQKTIPVPKAPTEVEIVVLQPGAPEALARVRLTVPDLYFAAPEIRLKLPSRKRR
jgi:hypothetical protein